MHQNLQAVKMDIYPEITPLKETKIKLKIN